MPKAFQTNYAAIRTFLVINSLNKWAAGMLAPVVSIFVVHVGGDLRHAGELASLFMLVSTLFGMWVSKQSPRAQRILFLASLALYVPGYLSLLLVTSHTELYVVQFVLGMVTGMNKPVTRYWMFHFLSREDSSPLTQRDKTATGFVGTVAALLGGYMSHHLGFESVFVAMAVISLLTFLVGITYLDRGYLEPAVLEAEGREA